MTATAEQPIDSSWSETPRCARSQEDDGEEDELDLEIDLDLVDWADIPTDGVGDA
jgi:hypothetical protein